MSLFEDDRYQWRETYFILFREADRPAKEAIEKTLKELGPRFEIVNLRSDTKKNFESVTVISPDDFSAMDVCYGYGEDVAAQIEELLEEMKEAGTSSAHKAKLLHLAECTSRLEIYHFQLVVADEEEDEFLDPGGLLLVMQKLAKLCHGISIDPQSGTWT